MKKVLSTLFGSLVLSVLMVSCAPTTDDAIKYNDALVDQQTKVIKAEDALIQAISQNTPEKLDEALNGLVKQIAASEEAVSKMEAFDGKTDYKDAALSLFKAYKNAAEKEYPEIIKIAKTPNEEYSQDMDDQLMTLSKAVDEKLNKEIEAFVAKQKEFSEKYKFELTTNKK
jgi:hypothetical protein